MIFGKYIYILTFIEKVNNAWFLHRKEKDYTLRMDFCSTFYICSVFKKCNMLQNNHVEFLLYIFRNILL